MFDTTLPPTKSHFVLCTDFLQHAAAPWLSATAIRMIFSSTNIGTINGLDTVFIILKTGSLDNAIQQFSLA